MCTAINYYYIMLSVNRYTIKKMLAKSPLKAIKFQVPEHSITYVIDMYFYRFTYE